MIKFVEINIELLFELLFDYVRIDLSPAGGGRSALPLERSVLLPVNIEI